FTAVVLLGNYVFFLYSVTPEVFALLDLFVIILVLVAIRWQQTHQDIWLYVGAFVFGLSLTHHHMVLFLVPAMWVLYWLERKHMVWNLQKICGCIGLFFAGLFPYGYVFIGGHGHAMINWDRPVDLHSFIQLV